jgi:hypothetical protein
MSENHQELAENEKIQRNPGKQRKLRTNKAEVTVKIRK